MINTIFIDIDNTLLCFNKNARIALKNAFIKNGVVFKEEFVPKFLTINDGLWKRLERKELTREGIYQIRFKTVLSALNLEGDADKIETEFRKQLFVLAETVDGAKDLLKYLSSKYKVYAASNSIFEQQVNRLKLAGLNEYFSGIFVSEKIGYSKPSREFFNACLNLANTTVEQAFMIGDSISADIKGAYEMGIKTIWYNHDRKEKPEEKIYDFYVENLTEIKDII